MKATAKERLWQKLSAGADRQPEGSLSGSDIESPWPGTLWVHPATALFAVEWLVIEHGHRRQSQYLLMPADCFPQMGLTDIAVPKDQPGGPLSIRCHLARWVSSTLLHQAKASGRVTRSVVKKALDRHRVLLEKDGRDSLRGPDGGPAPRYEDWIAEVELAWQALLTGSSTAETPTPPSSDGALLSLDYEGSHNRPLSAQTPKSDSSAQEPRRDGSMLRASTDSQDEAAVLLASDARADGAIGKELLVPSEAQTIVLLVSLGPQLFFPQYRLSLRDLTQDAEIWRSNILYPTDNGFGQSLRGLLNKSELSPETVYRLHIEGYWAPSWIPVCYHELESREPVGGFLALISR